MSDAESDARPFQLAVVQLRSTTDRAANRAEAVRQVRRAAALGAELICLPETWPYVGSDAENVLGAEPLDGPSVSTMRELARELGVWLFPGSVSERSDREGMIYNTSVALDALGDLRATYRKIHLFDVKIDGGVSLCESATVIAGDQAVIVQTPWCKVGMSICYDLRFPGLYRALAEAGAELILVQAAFTSQTGKDHWEVLLRARAIEQQLYVAAPNQGGRHCKKRESYGHSLVVDPWGLVVARASDGPGLAMTTIDPARVARVRRQLPCAEHHRAFTVGAGRVVDRAKDA